MHPEFALQEQAKKQRGGRGGIAFILTTVMPLVPAFHHRPRAIDDIVNQTMDRVLDLLAVEHPDLFKRWTGPQKQD